MELVGFADEDSQRGAQFARTFGIRYFQSYEELLEQKLHGVIVCSENSKHASLVAMAAEAKVNVLCEKPLATTVRDAQAMVQQCHKAGVILMTAFPMRFSAPIEAVKRELERGELGQVYCFNATNQGELPKRHRAWFVDKALAGGGAIMDHTVHLVDVMRWYLGSEVREVRCCEPYSPCR